MHIDLLLKSRIEREQLRAVQEDDLQSEYARCRLCNLISVFHLRTMWLF